MTRMDHIALDEQARAILRGNDRGGYTVPTAGLYPYQWNWDSAFSAWGFATFDRPRAWAELESLMSGQWPDGMVPHILFHKPDTTYFPGPEVWGTEGIGPVPSSGISQPPVAATLVRAIHDAAAEESADRARALWPRLADWHRWFMTWRNDGGAIFVTHPWESGRDNAPDWDTTMARIVPEGVGPYTRRDTSHVDPSMRPTKEDYDRYIWLVQRGRRLRWDPAAMAEDAPFRVADPTMTFILLRATRDLVALGEALGVETSEARGWIEELERGAARLRDPASGRFTGIDLGTGRHTGHVSNASFLCWYAGIEDAEMAEALDEALEACAYPVPSHPVGTPEFDPKRYWRGPTWAMMNCMIGRGLAEMGHADRARAVRDATARAIAEHGFAEYFNPLTGDPAGGGSFSWTAAVWLAWASPSAGAR